MGIVSPLPYHKPKQQSYYPHFAGEETEAYSFILPIIILQSLSEIYSGNKTTQSLSQEGQIPVRQSRDRQGTVSCQEPTRIMKGVRCQWVAWAKLPDKVTYMQSPERGLLVG